LWALGLRTPVLLAAQAAVAGAFVATGTGASVATIEISYQIEVGKTYELTSGPRLARTEECLVRLSKGSE
jgi:hypothetical protein